eukprot:Awhi_evm1s13665
MSSKKKQKHFEEKPITFIGEEDKSIVSKLKSINNLDNEDDDPVATERSKSFFKILSK